MKQLSPPLYDKELIVGAAICAIVIIGVVIGCVIIILPIFAPHTVVTPVTAPVTSSPTPSQTLIYYTENFYPVDPHHEFDPNGYDFYTEQYENGRIYNDCSCTNICEHNCTWSKCISECQSTWNNRIQKVKRGETSYCYRLNG